MINGPLSSRGGGWGGPADLSSGVSSIGVHVAPPLRILIMPSEEAENGEESGEISRLMRCFISLTFQSIIVCSWDLPLSTVLLHRFPMHTMALHDFIADVIAVALSL